MSLINPYDLLGFDSKNPNIEMKELKSQYYTLSLICHPDKGGSVEDMIILKNAYQYIKEQIEGKDAKSKDVKEVEEEFKNFMKEQENTPPPFSQIYEEAHLWLQDFNNKFKQSKNEDKSFEISLTEGYGDMMDTTYHHIDTNLDQIKEKRDLEIDQKQKPLVEFKQEIVTYTDPLSFNFNSSFGCNINQEKVSDFSINTMSDYKKAFTSADFETLKIDSDGDNNTDVLSNFDKLMAERAMLDDNLFEKSKNDAETEKIIQLKFEEMVIDRKEKAK